MSTSQASSSSPQIAVARAGDRFRTQAGWLDSRHSFSFGHHYDPKNTGFGLLLVSNDDIVAPGTGFETHGHRDMEIVTWVLSGSLVHQDSHGHSGVIHPGLAQRMSAGTGILHSEKNDAWRLTGGGAHEEPVRFVQMWVLPDGSESRPGYEQLDINAELTPGRLVTVASGMAVDADAAAIRIGQRDAALRVARLDPGQSIRLPEAPFLHLYVARGAVNVEAVGALAEGDAARISHAGGLQVSADAAAEILVWEMHSSVL